MARVVAHDLHSPSRGIGFRSLRGITRAALPTVLGQKLAATLALSVSVRILSRRILFNRVTEEEMAMNSDATRSGPMLRDLPAPQRQAVLEKIAVTLERNATWAGDEGDDAMELAMRSVGNAILSVAADLANSEVALAEDVAARALRLLSTFHARHPQYPIGPTLH